MLNMAFSQSKYYVDALSEVTKSGLREKVRRGEYPGPAPIGYINDPRTKRVMIDRERAPLIKEAFERYASGGETQETCAGFLARTMSVREQESYWETPPFRTCFQIRCFTAISATRVRCMRVNMSRSSPKSS